MYLIDLVIRRRVLLAAAGFLVAVVLGVVATGALNQARAGTAKPQAAAGYPNGRYPSPLRMGMFDHLQMGTFEPLGEDQLKSDVYWGMPHRDTFVDLLVWHNDTFYETANLLSQQSQAGPLSASPLSLALRTSSTGAVPDTCHKPWTGEAAEDLLADDHIKTTIADGTGIEQVIYGPEHFAWTSTNNGEYIDLQGTLVSPGIDWLLPWRDPSGATEQFYYTNQYYRVTGTYCGMPVHGYVDLEHTWGMHNYLNTWWVMNRVGSWSNWSTKYADGTQEQGMFLCGEYGERGAVVVNNKGQVEVDTIDDSARVEYNKDRTAARRIVWTMPNGEKWQYIDDPKGDLFTGQPGVALGVGLVERVGEKRQIIDHNAEYQIMGGRVCGDPVRAAR